MHHGGADDGCTTFRLFGQELKRESDVLTCKGGGVDVKQATEVCGCTLIQVGEEKGLTESTEFHHSGDEVGLAGEVLKVEPEESILDCDHVGHAAFERLDTSLWHLQSTRCSLFKTTGQRLLEKRGAMAEDGLGQGEFFGLGADKDLHGWLTQETGKC